MRNFLLLIVLVFLSSCSINDANETQYFDMRINHYQNTGMAESPVLTLVVQEGNAIGSIYWSKFYSNIEGFTYEPGKIYTLAVEVERINNPPADASALKYTLLEMKSVQEVSSQTLFDIDLKINGQSFLSTDSGYKLLNQIDIDCNSLCDELISIMQNQDSVVGTFKRLSKNEIQLIELK
jgi:hypothetical protein